MRTPPSKPRRLGWIAAVAALLAGLAAWAIWQQAGGDGADGARPPAASANAAGAAKNPRTLDKPLWRELSPAQQVALEPLHSEWDAMDGVRKKKWLEMSRRFASMNPTEQGRVHERMRVWMRLTPEQRNLARENYNKTRKLAPGDKAATWESYKQLTPGEKQRLAQTAARKKAATAGPPAPASTMIVTPTSCPAGTTRRGATCISLQPPTTMPSAPAITQPAPSATPALTPAPAPVPAPAAPASTAPAAPAAQPLAAPAPSNANG